MRKKEKRKAALRRLANYDDLKESGKLTEVLESRPTIPSYLRWVWDAFHALHTTRPAGMGPQAIPLSEIESYSRMMRFDKEETEELVFFIRRMDSVWLDWVSKNR